MYGPLFMDGVDLPHPNVLAKACISGLSVPEFIRSPLEDARRCWREGGKEGAVMKSYHLYHLVRAGQAAYPTPLRQDESDHLLCFEPDPPIDRLESLWHM
mmetsp:Transcript_40341/g.65369  ORF Transcript_40341/g.65369 Transcript_40341/m.65369 type:complete len:100 (-) Transcript_40341:1050-1349(-)